MVGGLWCFYLFFTGTFQTAFGGRAYEAGFGVHLFQNLMLYARWSVDLVSVAPDAATFSLRSPWIAGIPFFAIGVAGAIAAYRATRLPACGIAWWVLGLLPVLPLLRHTYVNYLYAPSAGLAMAIASLVWWLLSGRWVRKHLGTQTGMAKGAAIFACFALVMSLWSRHLIQRRVEEVLPNADMPRDTFVRKSELIRRVADRVATAVDSRACGIVFYIPAIEGTTQFLTDLLPTVLDDGRGLRALRPSIDSVAFIQKWSSAYDRFELFGGSVDGRVIHFGTGREAHIRLAKTLLGNGYVREAREYLESVLSEYSDDQSLLRMYHEVGGDRVEASPGRVGMTEP
jgi:hypothetical protein